MEIIKEKIIVMELQQSPPYAEYIKKLGWTIEQIENTTIFIKHIPLAGAFAKIQRIETLPPVASVLELFKKHHIRRAVLEAGSHIHEKDFQEWCDQMKTHTTVITSPYIPTKTILVDLTPPEETIFQQFSEAKRRAVRRAQKNELLVRESSNIQELIAIKNRSAGFLGFITTHGVKQLWEVFSPLDKATCVLAYTNKQQLIGGILLIFWEDIAYYWIAGANKVGKKLFAPTILAWEAMKIAKKRGAKQFDFVGVWDERFPKENKEWLGFTKFKEGFGGTTLYYPTHK